MLRSCELEGEQPTEPQPMRTRHPSPCGVVRGPQTSPCHSVPPTGRTVKKGTCGLWHIWENLARQGQHG
eukprot:13431341-Alexandrium_andersonii.AAC.1